VSKHHWAIRHKPEQSEQNDKFFTVSVDKFVSIFWNQGKVIDLKELFLLHSIHAGNISL
jgi:hypothetical protein